MLLKDKKGIILGVANSRSIAWSIAQAFHDEGARFAMTCQNEKIAKNVRRLASKLSSCPLLSCDVTSNEQIENVFQFLKQEFGTIDFLIHSIAYAPPKELRAKFTDVSREGFATTLEITAFSLTAVIQKAIPLMPKGGSIMTLTSLGGWRIVPNYHVMGVAKSALESSVRYLANDLGEQNIRVNGISPGPIRTVSAMGIRRFSQMLKTHQERSPLRRNVKGSDVAKSAIFLASDASSNITGEILFVDAGYHIIGI
ncbi:MAG: enoyl-ACP reductase [Chlamydiae bacterium]|nr:enoyl-ACP reductase [Chlamydiota bacterium]MBI3278138.1 enoyl-ACP reductase [Chlamydiota bacterium]